VNRQFHETDPPRLGHSLLTLRSDPILARMRRFTFIGLAALLASMAFFQVIKNGFSQDWRAASRASAGLAPDPATTAEAVVQVYAARAVRWRGYFGVHTWISAKRANAPSYQVYEVIGWRLFRGDSALVNSERPPDGRWFGAEPELLRELRGDGVDQVIDRIELAIQEYPYAQEYTVWPGPNSNTFTAFVARRVPELRLDLPPTAIGKDYIGPKLFAAAPSGSGFQVSLFGLFGLTLAMEEGLELNVLGLSFGIDAAEPALKLPMIGRLGSDAIPLRALASTPAAATPLTRTDPE